MNHISSLRCMGNKHVLRPFPCCFPLFCVAMTALLAASAFAGQSGSPALAAQGSTAIPAPQGFVLALQTQQVELTVNKQSFADVIASLCNRLHCAIVAEEEPVLQSADFDLYGNGKDILSAVADKFDYSWRVNKNGIVVLSRRFTSDMDVPQMRLPEMTQMASDFTRLLPDTGITPGYPIFPLNVLYRTLTPEQLAQMQSGTHIHFAQLLPEQQKWVHLAIVANMFSDSHSRWEHLHDLLTALPRARLVRRSCVWQAIVPRVSTPDAPALKEVSGQIVIGEKGVVRKDLMVVEVKGEELVCLWQDAQGQEQTLMLLRKESDPSPTPPSKPLLTEPQTDDMRANATPEQETGRSQERNVEPEDVKAGTAQAQNPVQDMQSAASGLNAPVHLRLGNTDIEHVAAAIETQTGVHVIVPRYLREHQLLVQVDGLSTRAALDAIAELNDWRVTVFSAKSVQIARPNVAEVQQSGEFPAALRGVLPIDFQRFLRVSPAPAADVADASTNPSNPMSENLSAQAREGLAVMRKQQREYDDVFKAGSKPRRVADLQKQRLWNSFPMGDQRSVTVTYGQLSPRQRAQLIEIIVLEETSRFFFSGDHLLRGDIPPFQQDETKADLSVKGSEIRVSSETRENNTYKYQAFGEPIYSVEKVPDPMHFGRH